MNWEKAKEDALIVARPSMKLVPAFFGAGMGPQRICRQIIMVK